MATSYKHLTSDDRKAIEIRLGDGRTFEAIAQEIGTSATTVSREVKRNRTFLPSNENKTATRIDCKHFKACREHGLCHRRNYCHSSSLCRLCRNIDCRELCGAYEKDSCCACDKAPYVCNACPKRATCPLPRHIYRAKSAQASSEIRATESRAGLDMDEREAERMLEIVRAGRAKGQSIHHIFATNDMPCTEGNFYKLVREGRVEFASIELAKAVKYKKRKHPRSKVHEDGFYAGRTMEDFAKLTEEVRAARTEGDTIWGPKAEDECLLSLHRIDLHFQIYLKLAARTAQNVIGALDWLEVLCGSPEVFSDLFDPLLVDRGSEFDDIEGMERSCLVAGASRCSVFFTDPQRPDQKGACEKNHVELRKICPKGTSFVEMDQYHLAEITSHVNSTVRYKCGDVSPMSLAMMVFPKGVLDGLGLRLIPPAEVVSRPGILY